MTDTLPEATHIALIARGVVVHYGHLLICRKIGADYAYLPGGHVEPGESIAQGLIREMQEELGLTASVGRCIALMEHRYPQDGQWVHELNVLAVMELPDLTLQAPPTAVEPDLEFGWLRLDQLEDSNVRPAEFRTRIAHWLLSGQVPLVTVLADQSDSGGG